MKAEVLIVGAGGIGAPAAWALGAAGLPALDVADDDVVELANLHRQVLFDEADVGRPKLDAIVAALGRRFPEMRAGGWATRATPDTIGELITGRRVIVDATDNFASRFLLADACATAGVAVVHAAAVRWQATVLAVRPGGRPCYRCLFEAPPEGDAPDCASAGVAGPVCGVAGAVAADRALRLLAGDATATGHVVTFDGRRDRLRAVPFSARPSCPLCGERPTICGAAAQRPGRQASPDPSVRGGEASSAPARTPPRSIV